VDAKSENIQITFVDLPLTGLRQSRRHRGGSEAHAVAANDSAVRRLKTNAFSDSITPPRLSGCEAVAPRIRSIRT